MTCTSIYFPQVSQSTAPWKVPLRIANIPEYLKLIPEAFFSKDVGVTKDADKDAEEEVEVDVDVET